MNRAAMKTAVWLDGAVHEAFGWKDKEFRIQSEDDLYDDLTVTGTLLELNGKYVYWLGIECIIVPSLLRDCLYDRLSRMTDRLDYDALILNSTHTHSGPGFLKKDAGSFHDAKPDQLYMGLINHLTDVMCNMFAELEKELQPFVSEIAVVPVEGCYGNRNDLSLPADKDVNLISFRTEDGKRIGMWMELTTHSTIIFPKNTKISGDLVGNVRSAVSEYYQCPVMPFVGCAGDSSTRLTRERSDDPALDYSELIRLVNEISSQIYAKASFEPLVIDRFETAQMELGYSYRKDPEAIRRRLEKLEQEIREEKDPRQNKIRLDSRWALERKLKGEMEVSGKLTGRAYNFGELKFGVFPGELVASLGMQIISHQPHDHHLVLGYTADYIGYLVEREEYGRNFESLTSDIPVGMPEVLTEMIRQKLAEYSN